MIFQAMAGWYRGSDVARHVVTIGTLGDRTRLTEALSARYGGEVVLYHKGRAALAEAIRLTTGGSGKVAISGLTCYSVVQAVEAAGCTPVYVDIREDVLQFGGKELTAVLTRHKDIKAVVIQNMLGIPADIAAIDIVAKKHNLMIIEDLAHSAGTHYADGREVGTVGDATILSFGRDKALDVVNGGALIVRTLPDIDVRPTREVSLVDQLRDRYYPLIAWVSRGYYPIGRYLMAVAIRARIVIRSADGDVDTTRIMTAWQAKLALRSLEALGERVKHRHNIARQYAKKLNLPVLSSALAKGAAPIRVPLLVSGIDERDMVLQRLSLAGIQANDIWYDAPVSPQRLFERVTFPADECPVAVSVADRIMNLPTHRRIGAHQVADISAIINREQRP